LLLSALFGNHLASCGAYHSAVFLRPRSQIFESDGRSQKKKKKEITIEYPLSQRLTLFSSTSGFAKLAPQLCKVRRDGVMCELNASQLVIGDIVFVKAGDRIPADLRIISAQNMKVS
jgi:hypothetical protein